LQAMSGKLGKVFVVLREMLQQQMHVVPL